MMYYYLAASLPGLALDKAPPLLLEEFVAICEEQLVADDFRALRALLDGDRKVDGGTFVRNWFDRDTQLRNAVVHARAARLHREAGPFLQPFEGFDTAIEEMVAEAFSRSSPEERERLLDELRWQLIDELAGMDMFSPEAILAYGLKLQLVERWTGLDESEGVARLESALKDERDESTETEADTPEPRVA